MLTAAVAADARTIEKAYEVSKLGKILDFINLMAYDLHGLWESTTGHHTAIEGPPGDRLTVSYALQYWMSQVITTPLGGNIYHIRNQPCFVGDGFCGKIILPFLFLCTERSTEDFLSRSWIFNLLLA